MALCDEIKDKISLYIDNELDEKEKIETEAHIKECGECRRFYNELKAISNGLRETDDIGFDKELHEKIMGGIKTLSKDKKKRNPFVEIVPAAACFILLCAVTVALTDMQNKKAHRQELEAQRNGIVASQEENPGEAKPQPRSAGGSSAGSRSLNTDSIIKESIELRLKAEDSDKALDELYNLICTFDFEAVLDRDEKTVEFSILKTDYEKLAEKIDEISEIISKTVTEEDLTQEYNAVCDEIDAADINDTARINELREKAFYLETDNNYYFVKARVE